jgi:salicylate hydroxylase
VPPLDIAIAGCGPGGLAAALLLHRAGHRVTLFERFEAPRPLGAGLILQPPGLAVLAALGLAERAAEHGARIDRLFGRAAPSNRIVLDVRYAALAGRRFGIGIHRGTLFRLLFDAVAAEGIAVETGREVIGAEARRLHFAKGPPAGPFGLVVDALGSLSPLAPGPRRPLAYGALWTTLDWVRGFDSHALEQRYRRAERMVGVLPIGRLPDRPGDKAAFFWSLRGDALPGWHAAGLDAWKAEALALWPETAPLLDQIGSADALTFARYCHHTLKRPATADLVHIGDAWHATSPQLGQGANMALLDSAALSAALDTEEHLADALARYSALRRFHVRLYQKLSRLLTPVYQSDGRLLPLLRDRLAGPLSRVPPAPRLLATLVSGALGAPLRRVALKADGRDEAAHACLPRAETPHRGH